MFRRREAGVMSFYLGFVPGKGERYTSSLSLTTFDDISAPFSLSERAVASVR